MLSFGIISDFYLNNKTVFRALDVRFLMVLPSTEKDS